MLSQCFASIMRARRAKPTWGPKKRTQIVLVKPDKPNNHPQHRCNWIISTLASSVIREESSLATGWRNRITKSNPAKSLCCPRNDSRNKRFARFRLAASRSILPATISPNLEWIRLLGLAKIWRNSLLAEHLNWMTEENSLALCNLWLFGNKQIIPFLKSYLSLSPTR